MRSKYERVSDEALLTADECESMTIALRDMNRRELRDYILRVEPALFQAAAWISNTATDRMVAAGLAGPLTGAIHEDVMHAVYIGYVLARGGSQRFTKELLDMAMPDDSGNEPTRNPSENQQ